MRTLCACPCLTTSHTCSKFDLLPRAAQVWHSFTEVSWDYIIVGCGSMSHLGLALCPIGVQSSHRLTSGWLLPNTAHNQAHSKHPMKCLDNVFVQYRRLEVAEMPEPSHCLWIWCRWQQSCLVGLCFGQQSTTKPCGFQTIATFARSLNVCVSMQALPNTRTSSQQSCRYAIGGTELLL